MYLEGFEAILIFSLKTILFKVLAKNKGGGGTLRTRLQLIGFLLTPSLTGLNKTMI